MLFLPPGNLRGYSRRGKLSGAMASGMDFLQLTDIDLSINGGGFKFYVAQELLEVPDVAPPSNMCVAQVCLIMWPLPGTTIVASGGQRRENFVNESQAANLSGANWLGVRRDACRDSGLAERFI